MSRISETDLILNADGSAYHLSLHPDDVADTIITVGDQDRVEGISKYFDHIELKKAKREFVTHTGVLGKKRITVISTGIGTDNIDIVFNELDALVNVDLETREVKMELKSLDIIRIGTSGAIQKDIPIDSLLVSEAAIGLDSLMYFYTQSISAQDESFLNDFKYALAQNQLSLRPYLASADQNLLDTLGNGLQKGVTITAPGFYAPQGRQVRPISATPRLLDVVEQFRSGGRRITNLEMETAGIYGLASALGHKALSFNVILANRITQQFSRQPAEIMDHFIREVLQRIA
jgi:uridine phosphorylase